MSPEAVLLAEFVQTLDLHIESTPRNTYGHIGATLADSVLQAGLNYYTVVQPRVQRIRRCFPEAETTSGTCELIACIGLNDFLNWRHPVKPMRLMRVLEMLKNQGVETEFELRGWLDLELNCLALAALHGIGPKTIDYLQILVGKEAVAVDRHIRTFVAAAGLILGSYDEIKSVVSEAAGLLSISRSSLDAAIWMHVTSSGKTG
jgi:hypothetical protein